MGQTENESFAAWGECVYWCTAGLSVVNSVATGNCIVNSRDKSVALFLDRTGRYPAMDAVLLAALDGTALWPEIRASSVCVSCALSSLAEQSVNPTFPVNTTCDWTVRQQTAKHWPRAEGPPSRLFLSCEFAKLHFRSVWVSEFQSGAAWQRCHKSRESQARNCVGVSPQSGCCKLGSEKIVCNRSANVM